MKKYISWIVLALVVALILGSLVWYASRPGKYNSFAGCIKQSGTIFYGAFWCSHCAEQKALFGKSASFLPYTECSNADKTSQTQVCIDNKIESYPTWQFQDGTRKTGTISLADLATYTGCPLIKDN